MSEIVNNQLQLNSWLLRFLVHTHARTHTHTHTHTLFSMTTWVSRCQKGKTNLDFTEARDSEWQWHQMGHMQVCTSLQTDNHASTSPLSFFTGRMPFLPPNQQRQSTEGNFLVYIYIWKKNHQFLWSIKRDAHKRKLVPFVHRSVDWCVSDKMGTSTDWMN